MANEVKIGILALLALGLSFWGYKFIQGTNILTSTTRLFVIYDNVGGLQIGTPVQISGVTVGAVSSIDLSMESRNVQVTLNLNKGVTVPKDTRAVIVSTSFLGGQAIYLEYDKPCSPGVDCAIDGDTLKAMKRGVLDSTLGEGAIDGYIQQLTGGLSQTLDTLNQLLLGEDSNSPVALSARDLQATLANLKSATAQVDALMRQAGPDLRGSLGDVRQLTATLAAQRGSLSAIIANADSLTQQMARADLQKTLNQVNATLSGLSTTLGKADTAVDGFSAVLDKVQQGEGTLGKLLSDEELYWQLSELSAQLDSLSADLQNRPYRYIPLKSRRRVQRYDRQDGRQQQE